MSTSNDLATQPIKRQERPIWQVALVALVVLLAISETVYLLVAMAAKSYIDSGLSPHDGLTGALSNGFFMYTPSENGPPIFMVKSFFGLPGFNTLFYLLFGTVDAQFLVPFITSGVAALLVGLLAILGYLTMSAGGGVAIKLLLALLFAVGWVVLYTGAESSMFGGSFWSNIAMHFLETPVAFVSLLVVSFFTRRRSD